jgi:predicted ATPase
MINEINLRNFKCFLDTKVNLNNLTVLTGANAVGKSSLIHSLLLIRETFDKTKFGNEHSSLKDLSQVKISLNGEYNLNLGDSAQILSSSADSEYISFCINNCFHFKYLVSKEKPEQYLNFIDCKALESPDNVSIFKNEFYYLNAERFGPRVAQNMATQHFSNTGTQGEFTGYTIANNILVKVDEERRFKSEQLTVPTLNKQVEYWLDFVIPGIEITTQIYNEIGRVGFYLKRSFSDTPPLNPYNIGFGISYVLPILVSGLIATKGSLLIVENPEAHLHPYGQSKIGKFLAHIASSGIQVVVETHSEHVLNGIRLASLNRTIKSDAISINYFALSEKSKVPLIKHITVNERAELSDWPSGFFDQEEKDLTLIFKGQINER